MRKKLTLILILILVLVQLCACDRPQAERSPAAGSEAAAPADKPSEAVPDGTDAPDEPDGTDDLPVRMPERVLTSDKYTAEVYTDTVSYGQYQIESREYAVSDGVSAVGYRAAGRSSYVRFFEQTVTEAGTVWYYDKNAGDWRSQALGDGLYASPVVVVELASGQTYFLALPRTFALRENGSREYLPEQDGILRTTKTRSGGIRITMDGYGLTPDCVTDALILTAPFELDWSVDNCAKAWVTYVKNGDSQWCFDGYYSKSPSNYIPSGENYYYCCAASYCIRGYLGRMSRCKEAPALIILSLDAMSQRQNQYGYVPTTPGSEWLQSDYGIGPGFYDTRFNTDLLEIYISAARRFGGNLFEDTVSRYLGFYMQLADTSHITTENGGWLIPDYWHPDELTAPHTSLNHQTSECLALYHAADLLNREDLRALADRMLLAIEDTGSGWVMPDHNFYYSVKPDGTYVEGDYPYLTYNDLYYLQEYLTGQGREENETLTYLMGEKLQWMQNHGVTGYEKG